MNDDNEFEAIRKLAVEIGKLHSDISLKDLCCRIARWDKPVARGSNPPGLSKNAASPEEHEADLRKTNEALRSKIAELDHLLEPYLQKHRRLTQDLERSAILP